jgi:Flp pilus assembly pilin Flp
MYVFALIVSLHSRLETRLETMKDRGATATEYAMLVAFIAVAIVIAVTFFGKALAHFFGTLGSSIGITADNAPAPAP